MSRIIEDVACTLCGCVCDDLNITTQGGRIVAAEHACPMAEPWFLKQAGNAAAVTRFEGKPATLEQAILHAADILRNSRAPLIYGLSRSSTPGQRAAVRLADQLGATIDTTASTCHAPSIVALQTVGESTSSLGEVRNRADLVVYWGANPVVSHPRHLERCVDAPGMFAPRGRADRRVVVVDVQETASSELADDYIEVAPGSDFEVIWALRAILNNTPLRREANFGGLSLEKLEWLADVLQSCRYGVFFFGLGLTNQGVAHANVESLLRLTTDLNAHTRFTARRMRVPGDVAGADSVLCWQTGFPFSVNLSRGFPRYSPGEYSANTLLEREEVDAVVLVGSEGVEKLSPQAQEQLRTLPCIALDYPQPQDAFPATACSATPCSATTLRSETTLSPTVQITTAVYGIHRAGTAYRMDEIPIPLRPVLTSTLPSDEEVLNAIGRAIRQHNP